MSNLIIRKANKNDINDIVKLLFEVQKYIVMLDLIYLLQVKENILMKNYKIHY